MARYPDPEEAPWALLARHLAGQTSAVEQVELRDWLHADPQHLQLLTTVTRAWERAGEGAPTPALFSARDVEAAWQRLLPQLTGAAPPAKPFAPTTSTPVVRPLWPAATWLRAPAWRLAASTALLAGAAYALAANWLFKENPASVGSYASGGQRQFVRLPDGSRVWLNAHSRLHYASARPSQVRQVQLTGEAYFDVIPAANRPFVVTTSTARVQAVGTAFNVRAYAAEDSVEVSVTRGRVWLARLAAPDSVLLTAHTRAALHAADAPGQVPAALRPTPIADANFRTWQTDTLRFVDAPVPQVAHALRATFGTRLTLAGAGLAQCQFTGTFVHPRPAQVLAVLQVALGATLQNTGSGQYTLRGEGCHPTPAKTASHRATH